MNVHKNARLTPHGRERIARQVASGQTPKAVGEAAGVCPRTVRKWVDRIVAKAWLDGAIAVPDRIVCIAPTPEAMPTRSRPFAASAGPASRSQRRSGVSPATVSRC